MNSSPGLAAFFASARAGGRWWELPAMRSAVGAEAETSTVLGHAYGPDEKSPAFAFVAADVTKAYPSATGPVRRSAVFLRQGVLIRFGIGAALPDTPGQLQRDAIHDRKQFSVDIVRAPDTSGTAEPLAEVDLAGVCIGAWVVMFHNEASSATSAVGFLAESAAASHFVVTGLAPGNWQLWRNGWLEVMSTPVRPREGALYFAGRPGSYFVRRLS